MNIRTEARIHVFLDKYTGAAIQLLFLLCSSLLMILLVKFFATNPVIIMNNNILTLMFNLLIGYFLIPMPFFILILIEHTPDIFDVFFANMKFKHNKILLCHLLLKKHHSSSKLDLELNKLKEAIENESQLYNDLNKLDFPYINKFVSRYYRYKKFNHTSVKDDLLQLAKSELNTQPLTLDNTSFKQLDDVLGNLVKDQIKQKIDEKHLVN